MGEADTSDPPTRAEWLGDRAVGADQVTALVVDHDVQVRRMATQLLRNQGIDPSEATTLAEARTRVAAAHYDLVVVHLTLPDGTGAELAAELGHRQPHTATILISASTAGKVGQHALDEGVDDYLPQPFSAEQLSVSVTRALRRRLERFSPRQSQQETGGDDETPSERLAEEVVNCLTRAGRFRDEETAEHVERVSRSCALIGEKLGLTKDGCRTLRVASAMHDIGKIGVPDGVLRKPGKLNPGERDLIERHAEIGYEILNGSTDPALGLAATIAQTHHERTDGDGYPHGLAGAEIPLAGRITAVADVFDALTHDRVYRLALPLTEALTIMRAGDGTQFDSEVLAAFHAVLPQIGEISELYPDTAAASSPAVSAGAHPPLRVLVVEDHSAMARGLTLILQREGMEIAGIAETLAEAERLVHQRDADVVVLDADLEGEDGFRLIPSARARDARVLLYTGGISAAGRSAELTPDGFASKAGGPAELVAAIREVAAGRKPNDSRVRPRPPPPRPHLLTPREREITALLAQGVNGEEIAKQLFLSPHTVHTHIRNAMARADAKTRAHLIALALEAGEIPSRTDPA